MILPTVIVCDPEVTRRPELEALVADQVDMVHLGTVSRQSVTKQELADGIQIIWIELAPDPQKGLALLSDLKDKYPRVNFLVSFEKLESDLVKTAMQLGAIEYLDARGAASLLPGALARIESKVASAPPPPPVVEVSAERTSPPPRPTKDPIRRGLTTPNLDPNNPLNALPAWLLPSLMVVMVIAAVVIFIMKQVSH